MEIPKSDEWLNENPQKCRVVNWKSPKMLSVFPAQPDTDIYTMVFKKP